MREIKFRAWAKDAANRPEVMWNWDMYHVAISEWIGNSERGVVIMQYTGLHDKNGKEIYEGDILKMHHRLPSVADYYSNQSVYWVDTHYIFGDAPLDGDLFQHGDNLEIIGNIYENPDLLTK